MARKNKRPLADIVAPGTTGRGQDGGQSQHKRRRVEAEPEATPGLRALPRRPIGGMEKRWDVNVSAYGSFYRGTANDEDLPHVIGAWIQRQAELDKEQGPSGGTAFQLTRVEGRHKPGTWPIRVPLNGAREEKAPVRMDYTSSRLFPAQTPLPPAPAASAPAPPPAPPSAPAPATASIPDNNDPTKWSKSKKRWVKRQERQRRIGAESARSEMPGGPVYSGSGPSINEELDLFVERGLPAHPVVILPPGRVIPPPPRVVQPPPRVVLPSPRVVLPSPRVILPPPRVIPPPPISDEVYASLFRKPPHLRREWEYQLLSQYWDWSIKYHAGGQIDMHGVASHRSLPERGGRDQGKPEKEEHDIKQEDDM